MFPPVYRTLRTPAVIALVGERIGRHGEVPQGTFSFVDPNTVLFTFAKDGTKVLLVLQKAVSYTVKQPEKDALSQFVAPPADNEGDDETPPLNPK